MVRQRQVQSCHLRCDLGRVRGSSHGGLQLTNPRQRLREIRPIIISSASGSASATNTSTGSDVVFLGSLPVASPGFAISRLLFVFCGRFGGAVRRPFTFLLLLLLLLLLLMLMLPVLALALARQEWSRRRSPLSYGRAAAVWTTAGFVFWRHECFVFVAICSVVACSGWGARRRFDPHIPLLRRRIRKVHSLPTWRLRNNCRRGSTVCGGKQWGSRG